MVPRLGSTATVAGPISSTRLISTYPAYPDPPPGGWSGGLYSGGPPYNPSPYYYYPSAVMSPGACTTVNPSNRRDPTGLCPPNGPYPFVVSADGTKLTFLDLPAHTNLPGVAASPNPPPASFLGFSTSLVGVDSQGNPHYPPLFSWDWNTTFAGRTGGGVSCSQPSLCSQSGIIFPIVPGSGTGGVTITSINGVQQTPPTISCAAVPNTLWPPNGKTVSVTVSSNIVQGTSPVASDGTTYAVIDSYGQDEPSGSFSSGGNGSYSFAVPLIAARNGNDQNGRTYTINVYATDGIGNTGSCSAVVTVPHDQGN